MEEIVSLLGVSDYWYSRIDFRFDSYTAEYREVEKINRLLVYLFYCLHPAGENLYNSVHGLTGQKIDACFRGSTLQVESYDKAREEPSNMILSRLEIRETKLLERSKVDIDSAIRGIQRRLDACLGVYDNGLAMQSKALQSAFLAEKALYNSPADFVQKNLSRIYTPQQMDEVFALLGVQNPAQARYNLIKRHPDLNIEFISKKAIELYILELKEKMSLFSQK